jgi:hypothetical protein
MKARKGVTPVVATALLLSIAVGSVITAGIFMDDTLQDLKEAFGNEVEEETANPDINVLSAKRDVDDNIVVVLRNSGGPVDLSEGDGLVIISSNTGSLDEGSDWEYISGGGIVSSGGTVEINISNPEFPDPGDEPVQITINGPREVSAGFVCYGDDDEC